MAQGMPNRGVGFGNVMFCAKVNVRLSSIEVKFNDFIPQCHLRLTSMAHHTYVHRALYVRFTKCLLMDI